MSALSDTQRGLLATIGAFLIWGVFPLYMRGLDAVPPVEIMVHRLLWCCVFVLALLLLRGELAHLRSVFQRPRTIALLACSAVLISLNWLVYVWAVSERQVVEASLGYFINPLVSVLLGVFVLRERLNGWQWLAVAVAGLGGLWLTWHLGRLPWIALVLALSFAVYGLLRKQVQADALTGLAVETLLLSPLAVVYLVWLGERGALGLHGFATDALLLASGVFTAVPLMCFAYGLRRIPLSTVGLLQYLGPTLQLLIGVWLFAEPFSAAQGVGFGLIWFALAIYAGEGMLRRRRPEPVAAPEAQGT